MLIARRDEFRQSQTKPLRAAIVIVRHAATPNEWPTAIIRLGFLSTTVTAVERNAQFGALASPNGEEFKRIQTFTIPGVQFLHPTPSRYHAITVNMIYATFEYRIGKKVSLSDIISNHSYGIVETLDCHNCGNSRNYAICIILSGTLLRDIW